MATFLAFLAFSFLNLWQLFKKLLAFIFPKYVDTMAMHIKLSPQHCNVRIPKKPYTLAGFEPRDLLFCRRTRLPLCMPRHQGMATF
jgi:hypothetical protein